MHDPFEIGPGPLLPIAGAEDFAPQGAAVDLTCIAKYRVSKSTSNLILNRWVAENLMAELVSVDHRCATLVAKPATNGALAGTDPSDDSDDGNVLTV